jgi:hypothetical protein
MGLVYFRRLLSFVIVSLVCVLQAHAQISGGGYQVERFLSISTGTSGTIQCATNTGTPIEYQTYSDYPWMTDPDPVTGPTAMVKGNGFTVHFFVYIPGPFKQGMVTLESITYNGNALPGSMPAEYIDTDEGILYGFDIFIDSAPECVYAGNLQIDLHTTEVDNGEVIEGHSGTSFRLYTVCNAPINCMSVPWVGVLEDSCTWTSGKTTVEEVISSITTGLYNSGCIFYDSNTVLSLGPNVKNEFPLANFLSYSRPVNGQCYDASNYNIICLYSQGRPGKSYLRFATGFGFHSNLGVLIGHFDFITQSLWSNHQLVKLGDGTAADPTIGLESRGIIPISREPMNPYWAVSQTSLIHCLWEESILIPGYHEGDVTLF